MANKSLKVNSILNLFHTIVNVLFPLISFPYASRILFAEGIGLVNFAQSYVNYFVLLAGLGVPIYGVRMVAKHRDNKELLSKKVIELMIVLILSTISFFLIYCISINFIPSINQEKQLFILMGLIIPFSILGIEWFYQGIEEYVFITVRSIIFKVLSLILLFTFVKNADDYVIYAAITVFALVGNNLVNFISLRKHISFIYKPNFNIKEHIKPLLLSFTFILATSIYVNLDTVMLGFLSTNRAVGLYSASLGLIKSAVIVVTSMGVVFIPRISYYVEKKDYIKVQLLAKTSYSILILLGIPAVFGLFYLADNIMLLFAGHDFSEATYSMRILVPIIIFLGISNLIGLQVLYPYGKEKLVLKSVFVGALVNLILNFFLIPSYAHIGAALGTLFAEMVVALLQIKMVKPYLDIKFIDRNLINYLTGSIIMLCSLYVVNEFLNLENLFFNIFIGVLVYFLFLLLIKDQFLFNIIIKQLNFRLKGRD